MIPFADVPKRCHCRLMTLTKMPLLIVATFLITGCKDQSTIANTTKLSPDGAMVATARTEGYGGPGTAAVITTVTLGGQNGRGSAEILSIEQNDSRPDHVALNWTSDRTLRMSVRDAQIDFQAVKSGGVTIETAIGK
jgi:uncharacterized lipoprotein YajG